MDCMLPVDVLHAVCSFLSGFEVFRFSHTNSWTLSVLSENLYWQKRVTGNGTPENPRSWKQRYIQERSLLFVDPQSADSYIHGMLLGCNQSRLGFAKFERPPDPGKWRSGRVDLRSVKSNSFSFDLWFCLFPGTVNQPAGGVIYGLQSEPAIDRSPGENPGQFVMVDTKSNLYCSVLDEKHLVARDLKPNCWYHVVLIYDVDRKQQEVYVDGKLASIQMGSLNSMWHRLKHEQIGTGFCGDTERARGVRLPFVRLPHSRQNGGWYSFYGLIDEFRVWNGTLPAQAVAKLARCEQPDGFSVLGTIKRGRDRRGCWTNTHSVRCTRPAEGKNVIINRLK